METKLISVAQFLKCSNASNYNVDDRDFLADFLDKPNVEVNDDSENETDELDFFSKDNSIDQAELSSLYYVAGYCIKKVKKSNTHCTLCLQTVEHNQSTQTDQSQRLVQLKEYKANCLVFCTDSCISLFENVENIFRGKENSFGDEELIRTTSSFSKYSDKKYNVSFLP